MVNGARVKHFAALSSIDWILSSVPLCLGRKTLYAVTNPILRNIIKLENYLVAKLSVHLLCRSKSRRHAASVLTLFPGY